jgi:predicted mannosyl-3-phosphoglycerate phosphatase (HAD superfamily)
MAKIIFVDIDETICITPDHPREYKKAKPILENIQKVNDLY